jgi:fructose-bisphosphate aldolase class II
MGLLDIVPPGVVTGKNLLKLFEYARANNFAIPAINCTSTR